MRVEGGARTGADGADGAGLGGGRFGEALARAERAGRGAGRGERARAERAGREEGARVAEARSRPEPRGRAPRLDPARAPAGPGDEGCAATAAAAGTGRGALTVEVAPAPELAAVVRVLPPAVAALGAPGAAPLALSFGRSLDVELRATPAGVDVVLRPAPGLARAAEAELPRLVAALRIRGVAVAGAEVRPRGQAGGRAR